VGVLRQGVAHQQASAGLAPSATQCRQLLSRNDRALAEALRKLGRPAEAAAVALERQALWPDDPVELYDAACELALCVPLVEAGRAAPSAAGRAERRRYADQAMAALVQAVRSGFKDLALLKTDPDLDPLRPRPDFQLLVLDVAFPADPFAR
jgi:hypothetical protein